MSATLRNRLVFGIVGFLIGLALAVPSLFGQPANQVIIRNALIPIAKAKDAKEGPGHMDAFNFAIDEDRAPKIIDSVQRHLKPDLPADEWKDIIINLQALLDDPSDKLVEWTDTQSKDRKPKKESIRIVANKLIGRFSKQGRDFYQREAGAAADQKLKEALERGDYRLLNDVSLRYFHTNAGAEATVLMGRNHLDRGRFNAAAETFRRYKERNVDDVVPISVNLMAALAFKRLAVEAAARNDKDARTQYQADAEGYWQKVRKEVGGGEITLGYKKVNLAQLDAVYNAPIDIRVSRTESEWNLPRGNVQNNGQGMGGRPFLDPSWDFSMLPIVDKEAMEKKGPAFKWIEERLRGCMQLIDQRPNHPPLPAFFPVASAGRIIFRTYDGIYCLSTRNDPQQGVRPGEMLWMRECVRSLFEMVSEGAKRVQTENWLASYMAQGPVGIFFENGLIGSLSHDGTLVYFVDDIAVPPHPQFQNQMMMQGQPMFFSPAMQSEITSNILQAINMDTGKLVWQIGHPKDRESVAHPGAGGDEKESAATALKDAYYLGAPLPLAGKIYVVVEKDKLLRLICLDPNKVSNGAPELVWSQPLGSPLVPMPNDTPRRIQGISLAYSDNTLIVPTNAGAVLAIDLLSHSILWARSYRTAQEGEAARPNNEIFMNGRRAVPWPNNGMPGQNAAQLLNADRWRSSTPIIVSGKVIFTAYDANAVICYSLRDGEILWEAARSSDDLYVAGVYENKVMVVGKGSVKFLDLNNGGKLLGSATTGTPSGVGAYSNGIYFLPLRPSRDNPEPEILSIDVNSMKVVAHTRSRKKIPTGNLIFFDNAVFSQSATSLISFPQLDIKIAEAEKRIAANPNDPIGLAEMGDLKLDNGELLKAIESYNKCLANKPSAETRAKAREKLYDAITELLQRDFNAGEPMLAQYKDLCTVEISESDDALAKQRKLDEEMRRKSNYYCLLAKGKENQGKLVEAFDNYLAFGTLTGNKELVSVIDQPNTEARPDVWARGRINHMMERATAAQRKPLEERARKQWEEVKQGGDLEPLRNFVRIFGTSFETGNEARLLLAERLMATNNEEDLREAANILLALRAHEDFDLTARATEALARLYIRKNLFDDAMGLYSELNHRYGAVVFHGKTGAEIYNDLITDKRFLPYIEPLRQNWTNARFKASESTGNQLNQTQQSFTISPEGDTIPFYGRHKVVVDMMTQGNPFWTLKVIDRLTGEERFRSHPLPAPQYIWNYPQTNNHRFAQIHNHLLILNLNNKVYAFDLADRRKLWEFDLFGKLPMPMQVPPRTEVEADGVRLYYQDGWTQKVGQVGVIQSDYVCLITRDGLVAVDPATGTTLWTKSNVSSRVQLMGDESYVFVFESNAEGAVTSARAIRASDGVEVQIQDSAQVFSNLKKAKTAGRRVLVLDEKDKKKSLRLYDILTGKDIWTRTLEGSGTMLRCEDPNLAGFLSDKGQATVFNVKDGKEVFTARLDEKNLAKNMERLDSALLLTDHERFYVVLNRQLDNNNFNYNPSLTPGIRTVRVNGAVYCFDRVTRKRLWRTDEQFENQQIILDQFADLPIIIGAHWYNRINNGVFEGNGMRVVAIDKRTGMALYKKEVPATGMAFHALIIDPKTGVIELVRSDMRITFTPELMGKATSSLIGTAASAVKSTPSARAEELAPMPSVRGKVSVPVELPRAVPK